MNEELYRMCMDFTEYQTLLKGMYTWTSYSQVFPVAAYICLNHRDEPNEELLRLCDTILRENSGTFSNFRGNGKVVYIAMLSTDIDPGARMERAAIAYEELRDRFSASSYLPLLALIMAKNAAVQEYPDIARRTKTIFDAMNAEHAFLTSSEDSVFAGLLALQNKPLKSSIDEMEEIYEWLNSEFSFHRNSKQTLSHALVLCEGEWYDKCMRLKRLCDALDREGIRYSRDFALVPLAILANMGIETEQLLNDMLACDAYLQDQSGYGFLGFSSKKRLMHAAMITAAYHMTGSYELSCAVIIGELLEIAAQQAAAAAAAA